MARLGRSYPVRPKRLHPIESILWDDNEGGTPGTTTTLVYNGSGDIWSNKQVDAGATLQYDNTHFMENVAMLFQTTTSGVSWTRWTTAAWGTTFLEWYRFYFYVESLQNLTLLNVDNDVGTTVTNFRLTSSGQVAMDDRTPTNQILSSASTYAVNNWYRAEISITHSTTVGAFTLNFYQGDSTTALFSQTASTINTGANASRITLGIASAVASGKVWLDDVQATTRGWIGPSGNAPAPTSTPFIGWGIPL